MENCQLSGAYLAKANLQGADLSHVQYIGGDLIGADLRGANLAGATLEAIDASKADFSNASLRSSHLNQCYFEKARFDETDLADSQLQDCNFAQSHLDHANLARSQATECSFTECHLNDANLAGTKALECEFDRAHLKGAILVRGDYTQSSFDDVHLQGSFLNGARFAQCSLEGADLRNSKVREADFTGARLFQTTLNGANMEFARLEAVWTYDREPEPEFPKAMDLYRNLKNTLRDNGAHSRASRYSYLESVMQRRQFRKQERWGMWVLFLLADAVCGYGEHIEKILATALALILIYAAAYHVGEGVVNRTLSEDADQDLGFREHLYFSVTTFTTLGYGDYSPAQGPYQILAVSEAILGVVLMAFLVVTLTRKIVT